MRKAGLEPARLAALEPVSSAFSGKPLRAFRIPTIGVPNTLEDPSAARYAAGDEFTPFAAWIAAPGWLRLHSLARAGVAELVDANGLGPFAFGVQVRVLSPVPRVDRYRPEADVRGPSLCSYSDRTDS